MKPVDPPELALKLARGIINITLLTELMNDARLDLTVPTHPRKASKAAAVASWDATNIEASIVWDGNEYVINGRERSCLFP